MEEAHGETQIVHEIPFFKGMTSNNQPTNNNQPITTKEIFELEMRQMHMKTYLCKN